MTGIKKDISKEGRNIITAVSCIEKKKQSYSLSNEFDSH